EALATLPVLSKPTSGVPLILYLAVTDKAVSTVLPQEEGNKQKVIYFVSHTLQGAELRYQKIEKAALAILKTARRLRPYFQSFQVKVKNDVPLRQVLQKPDLSGRLVSWSVELSEYDIQYEPRGQVTIQSLIDFVAELTPTEGEKTQGEWVLSVDGSSNNTGSGAG
ncbi:RNase H-like domain-containing protein, partial [Bradyrhizobium sp. TM233]|uniref:RNase H-like domain-containing protein n=1 Tax=Bradyrhizobium sp. TM233 TaxID=2599801 RepID=UPI0030C68802